MPSYKELRFEKIQQNLSLWFSSWFVKKKIELMGETIHLRMFELFRASDRILKVFSCTRYIQFATWTRIAQPLTFTFPLVRFQ